MENPLDSYPLSKCRQGTLFQRNPVCALCFRVCKELCETYGSIHFDLLHSMQAADSLCAYFVEHASELPDVVQCHQWLENHLNSEAEVMCACATISLSIAAMTDAPEPLHSLGQDLRCLVHGEAGRIYTNLSNALWHEHIAFSANAYGTIPTIIHKQTKRMQATQNNQYNKYLAPVYQGCTFNNTTNNYYQPPEPAQDSKPENASYIIPVPQEGNYNAVREYIEERKIYDKVFAQFCKSNTRKRVCEFLSDEFGWIVDEHSLGANMNRKR